jgi:hypothetical protein
MPTAAHATNMAANPGRGNDRANEAAPSTTERPPHVENLTRVTVAFPFATINTAEPDTQHTVRTARQDRGRPRLTAGCRPRHACHRRTSQRGSGPRADRNGKESTNRHPSEPPVDGGRR